jgi:hypothetical protein
MNRFFNHTLPDMMAKSHPGFFYLFCMLFQVIFTFQGMDLADSGFNAVFYQQIFDNPKSVEYNFMFWLTGVTGGLFTKAFPFMGLWGYRLLGVIINTLSIILSYRLLIRHIPKTHAMIGLFLVLLTLNNEIKELNYNIMSGLMNMLIITVIYHAVARKRILLLYIAGMLCAINMLTRIPNILSAGFFLGVLFYQFIQKDALSKILRNVVVAFVGFLSGIAVMIAVLKLMGHWEHFKYALGIVFNLANDNLPVDDASANSYGAATLIKQCIQQTLQSLSYALYFFLFLFFIYLQSLFSRHASVWIRNLARLTSLLTLLAFIGILWKESMSFRPVLFIYTGIGMLCSFYWLFQKKDPLAGLLSALGMILLIYYPFGSSFGLVTAGRYSFWISIPLAVSFFLQFKGMESSFSVTLRNTTRTLKASLIPDHIRSTQKAFLVFAVITGLYFCYYYPFFDWRDRRLMTHGFTSTQLKGIYTTKGRADAVNELITATTRYANPGTLLLAYDDIPMINYASQTIPYMNNSMPWLYPSPLFEKELNAAKEYHKKLPVIVKQKVKTFGDGSEWPEKLLPQPYEEWDVNQGRNKVMNQFIKENNYKIVWASDYFEILIPQM